MVINVATLCICFVKCQCVWWQIAIAILIHNFNWPLVFTQFIEIGWKATLSIGTGYFRFFSLFNQNIYAFYGVWRGRMHFGFHHDRYDQRRVFFWKSNRLELIIIRCDKWSFLIIWINKFRSENWKNLLKRNLNLSVYKFW